MPLEGVHVEDSQRHVSVKTDVDGSYRIENVAPGGAYFFFGKDGYRSQTRQFPLTDDTRVDVMLVRQ
jgi:hypothetical protein